MRRLELIKNNSVSRIGNLFCEECAIELNVVLSWFRVYRNPQYKPTWDVLWHEFNAVRYVVPHLVIDFYNEDFTFSCPECGNKNPKKLTPASNGLLDLELIRASMKAYSRGFDCIKCENYYASTKMGCKVGGQYICGDCAALA